MKLDPVCTSHVGRRNFIKSAGAVAALSSFGSFAFAQDAGKQKPRPAGGGEKKGQGDAAGYTLPELPYAYDALEPAIDAETMKIHHTKHHQAYINNLNAALASHEDLRKKSLEELLASLDQVPEDIRKTVRNNGGGHYNHSLFWKVMAKGKSAEPTGELAQALADAFGGFAAFKEQFSQTAIKQFGSGWAWLSVGNDGKLELEGLPNQDNPIMSGKKPILGLDVWEHAYYLKYRNVRPDYVAAWWSVVNWQEVAKNYAAAKKA